MDDSPSHKNADVTTPGPRDVQWHDEPRPRWLPPGDLEYTGRAVLRPCIVQEGDRGVGGIAPDPMNRERWYWWLFRDCLGGWEATREAAMAALEAAAATNGLVVRHG